LWRFRRSGETNPERKLFAFWYGRRSRALVLPPSSTTCAASMRVQQHRPAGRRRPLPRPRRAYGHEMQWSVRLVDVRSTIRRPGADLGGRLAGAGRQHAWHANVTCGCGAVHARAAQLYALDSGTLMAAMPSRPWSREVASPHLGGHDAVRRLGSSGRTCAAGRHSLADPKCGYLACSPVKGDQLFSLWRLVNRRSWAGTTCPVCARRGAARQPGGTVGTGGCALSCKSRRRGSEL
jgi:hypothetical protein